MKIIAAQVRTSTIYKIIWPKLVKSGYPISEREFMLALRQVFNDPKLEIRHTLNGAIPPSYTESFYFLTLFHWGSSKQGRSFWERIHSATVYKG